MGAKTMHNKIKFIFYFIVHCFSSHLFYALIPFIEHFLKHVVSCTDIYIYFFFCIYKFIVKSQISADKNCISSVNLIGS